MQTNSLRTIGSVALGGIVGALIALPAALSSPNQEYAWVVPITFLAGLGLGYRKRDSSFFFYFLLLAVLALSTLLMRQIGSPQ